MIIEPSNYTYETMPDYTDAVDGAEIPVTGEEIEIRYARVVYDEAHNLHLEIIISPWCTRGALAVHHIYSGIRLDETVCLPEGRHDRPSGAARLRCCNRRIPSQRNAHFPAQIIDAKNAVRFRACGGIQAESIADVPDGRFFRRTGFFRCRHDRKERENLTSRSMRKAARYAVLSICTELLM